MMGEVADGKSSGRETHQMGAVPEPVTVILEAVSAGEEQAAERLLPLLYDELRRLAAAKMAKEAPGQTLQPTALVHEAWLRLIRVEDAHFQNRAHFFAAAAEAMRRILIEQARRKSAGRHGGGLERVDLEGIDLPEQANTDLLLRVDTALEDLAREDARAAALVKLRFFAGLSMEQAALALGVTDRTARRDWRFARAWLFDRLRHSGT
jgi:RNA polymerase sigma factor (TIGR02999 family)